MSVPSSPQEPEPALSLPENPDLRHLRDQAKDLVNAGEAPTLSDAQFRIARRYGFASWPKLKAHVESLQEVGRLKAAITANDLEGVKALMTKKRSLHRAPLGYGEAGPLTWAAECRGLPLEAIGQRVEIARWMLENGSDVHQGGDAPLMRAALYDQRIPMMELLVAHGADVNALWAGTYPIVLAPCECLAPDALRWLIGHSADVHAISPKYGNPIAMVLGTYTRNAAGKAGCLETLVEAGCDLPDTPLLALHRGRLDLLGEHLRRDPSLLTRRFSQADIYPADMGLGPTEGLHVTPVDGTTLLHLAIEFDDLETAQWLIEQGADVNARASIDTEGFGGHTPLFHAVVTLGKKDDAKARLLVERGADPNARTTLRKQLVDTGNPETEKMREFHNVTPIGYARRFQEPGWVSEPALTLLAAHGGME
jgi:ankyrin repeat protein